MSERFVLNYADVNNPLWPKLKKHMESELAILRQRNDSIRLDERATQETRGRIAQLKELIALGDPQPGVDS